MKKLIFTLSFLLFFINRDFSQVKNDTTFQLSYAKAIKVDSNAVRKFLSQKKFNPTLNLSPRPSFTGGSSSDGRDVRIYPSSNVQAEIHISVDETNPNNILASANTYTSTYQQGYYYSTDGGSTWSGSDQLANSTGFVNGDPSTAYDGSGNAYISTINAAGDSYLLQESENKGVTWGPLIQEVNDGHSFDKEMIAADNSPMSPYQNNVYSAWTDFTSHTVKFNQPGNTPISLTTYFGQGANVQTGPNGEVYVCWANLSNGYPATLIGFAKSTNGGVSFTTSTAFNYLGISQPNTGYGPDPRFNNIGINDFPSMAVDKSQGPYRGRIYVVVPQESNGTAIIQMRYSSDGGDIWSGPITINIPNATQCFFPWITVDDCTGAVYITYYAFDQPNSFSTNTYVAFSEDGGNSFINQVVSDAPHITQPINDNVFRKGYEGDYIGICSYGSPLAAWMDNRNGTWQVYVSPVTFSDASYISGTYINSGNNYPLYTVNHVTTGETDATVNYMGATSYTWSLESGNPAYWSGSGNHLSFDLSNNGDQATFKLIASRPCSTQNFDVTFTTTNFYLYPNPANEYINISTIKPGNQTNKISNPKLLFDVQLYDKMGYLIRYIHDPNGRQLFKISVSTIPPGIYIVRVN
ncbi:MAG: T9SS type A sorting domain-containing protein, partial [Chitinophagaceae bacterium]